MSYFNQIGNSILTIVISAILVSGCSDNSSTARPGKEQIQYLSHIDQAKFYQKQGQLKESILEARNAIKLGPSKIEPFLIIGENLLIAGDGRSAEKQLRTIFKSNSADLTSNTETRQLAELQLARALFIQRKAEEAILVLNNLTVDGDAERVEKSLLLADIHLSLKAYNEADNYFNEALSVTAASAKAFIGLSKSARFQNNDSKSDEYLREAENADPDNPRLWLWKAQIAQYEKRWADSEEAYIKALEDIGSFDIMTYEKYKTISDLIAVLREQGKAAEAFVYEEVLAKSTPGTIKSTYMSAVRHFQNGAFKKAASDLESLLDQAPGHTQSGILLGITKYYLGHFADAEKLLSTYLQEGDSIAASKVLAATKLRLRQPKEAKAVLAKLEKSATDPQLMALFGVASLATGDTDTGLDYINRALELDPSNSELRLKLATYYISVGASDKAVLQLNAVDKASTDIHKAKMQLVALFTKNGEQSKAREIISGWKANYPENAEPLIAEAGMATFDQQFAKAEKRLRQALAIEPSNTVAALSLANIQIKLNQRDAARTTLESAISKSPNNTSLLKRYLSLSSATKDSNRDQDFFSKLVKRNPENKALQLALAEVFARHGNLKAALEIADKLGDSDESRQQLQPAFEAIYSISTQTALNSGDQSTAIEIATKARQTMPDSLKMGLLLASVQFKYDNKNEATAILRALKIEHSDSDIPYEFEGDYYARSKDFPRAVDAYRLARSKGGSDNINVKIYNALKAGGKLNEALEHLEDWEKASPLNPKTLSLLALHYQTGNKKEKAISRYRQLLTLNANDYISLNNLAWLYFETNNNEAEFTAKKAFDLKPDSAAVADTYGWILFKNNKIKESSAILERAYKLAPKSQEIALHLAEVYEVQGMKDESNKIRAKFN